MILVEHAVVVTMDPARRIFLDGSVLIDGERIAPVGRAAGVRPPRAPERVIDGRGHLVHPGFIDTHGRFSEMLDAGISVSLGGDSANGSNHFDMLRLMYLAALVPKDARLDPAVMPPERVHEMATLHGARALGLEDEIGSLEPGKRADMVIFDLDLPEWRPLLDPVSTLVYSASAASVRTVVVDGRVLLDDRRVATVDEREALARAERLSGPYLARAGLAARPKWPVIKP